MNREIKFRGKVKWNGNHYSSGCWVFGDLVRKDGKTYIFDNSHPCDHPSYARFEMADFLSPRNEYVEVIPKTVGQYTGLKDRNGVEIYEGDIVRQTAPDHDFMRDYPEGILLEVKYGAIDVDELVPQFYLTEHGKKDREEWRETFIDYYDYEVVGNIHDERVRE